MVPSPGHKPGRVLLLPEGFKIPRLEMSAFSQKQTLIRTVYRLAQPRLFGQHHLELDRRQLLRRHADALQERQPARVVVDVGE